LLTWEQISWDIAMVLASGYALWRGGRSERLVAVANVAAAILTGILPHSYGPNQTLWEIFAVDLAFFALLLWLALVTDRIWLLFAAAFQLLPLVVHMAILLDGTVQGWAYRSGLVIFNYLLLISLAVGTWLHDGERRASLRAPGTRPPS
jgi:hypothetical protein